MRAGNRTPAAPVAPGPSNNKDPEPECFTFGPVLSQVFAFRSCVVAGVCPNPLAVPSGISIEADVVVKRVICPKNCFYEHRFHASVTVYAHRSTWGMSNEQASGNS